MREENKEKYEEIITLVNDSKYVEAQEIFEELFVTGIKEMLTEKKDEIIERVKMGDLNEKKSKKLTEDDLDRISKRDEKERKKNEQSIPFRYVIGKKENAIYGEF